VSVNVEYECLTRLDNDVVLGGGHGDVLVAHGADVGQRARGAQSQALVPQACLLHCGPDERGCRMFEFILICLISKERRPEFFFYLWFIYIVRYFAK